MKGNEMDDKLIKKLRNRAERTVQTNDEFEYDNTADAYSDGCDDGVTLFAQEILEEFGIKYNVVQPDD